ncbi:MAG: hypothetical protein LKJ05_06315, partial [Bifidobacteriaceae bacterium]|nr:hypothetical protein [Bifidobacteriaceae bacterium]
MTTPHNLGALTFLGLHNPRKIPFITLTESQHCRGFNGGMQIPVWLIVIAAILAVIIVMLLIRLL